MVRMYEALMIGLMSGLITFLTLLSLERLPIDDPCGSFAVHGMNGAWGLLGESNLTLKIILSLISSRPSLKYIQESKDHIQG